MGSEGESSLQRKRSSENNSGSEVKTKRGKIDEGADVEAVSSSTSLKESAKDSGQKGESSQVESKLNESPKKAEAPSPVVNKESTEDTPSSKPNPLATGASTTSWLETGTSTGFGALAQNASVFGETNASVFGNSSDNLGKTFGTTSTEKTDSNNLVFGNQNSTSQTGETQDMLTGEEDEICVHQVRAKLFHLREVTIPIKSATVDSDQLKLQNARESTSAKNSLKTESDGNQNEDKNEKDSEKQSQEDKQATSMSETKKKMEWKEMGAGIIHVNKPKTTDSRGQDQPNAKRPRLVMRREGVLKLLLNASIWPNLPVERASDKIIRFTCSSTVSSKEAVSEPPKPGSYLLRLPRKDQCDELYNAIIKTRDSM
mmetsp:Transcript_12737/g.14613  ORF Transcript_12737/g.14613 Transcript_12737/m.14613 type:complete len:372 (+) Transcript_12737:90-1205(+)